MQWLLLSSLLRMTLLFVCDGTHKLFDLHDPCPLTPTAPADYTTVTRSFTFTRTVLEHNVTISIVNDSVVETMERFFANLRLVSSNAQFLINPARATVNIRSGDGRLQLVTQSLTVTGNLQSHIIKFIHD